MKMKNQAVSFTLGDSRVVRMLRGTVGKLQTFKKKKHVHVESHCISEMNYNLCVCVCVCVFILRLQRLQYV